jgi:hypothetical protein
MKAPEAAPKEFLLLFIAGTVQWHCQIAAMLGIVAAIVLLALVNRR